MMTEAHDHAQPGITVITVGGIILVFCVVLLILTSRPHYAMTEPPERHAVDRGSCPGDWAPSM